MSTPTPVFTSLTTEIDWTVSVGVDANGNPLPAGEAPVSSTLGFRPDGNASFGTGNYQFTLSAAYSGQPAQAETMKALANGLGKSLPPGNYWLGVKQTDQLGTQTIDSAWVEIPFSIPPQPVAPASPTAVSVK